MQNNKIESKIVFISVNKKVDEKIYVGTDASKGLSGPKPGTLVSTGLTDASKEYFLVG